MTAVYARKSNIVKKNLPRFFQYLILIIITLIVLVPIVIMVFGALKTRGEMFAHPYTIPIPAHWENFVLILNTPSFWTMLLNSLIVALGTTLGVLIVCSLASFVFARMQFRGKDLAFNFLTLGLMFPITIAIMPVYLVVRQMELIDSLQAVILVQIAFAISANILILRGFFTSIPM
jgi:raffinose/stachyose/melibiose transport system permease protein